MRLLSGALNAFAEATVDYQRLLEVIAKNVALRSEEHTSELQSHVNLVCRLLLEKKKNINAFECLFLSTAQSQAILVTFDTLGFFHGFRIEGLNDSTSLPEVFPHCACLDFTHVIL